MANFEDDDFFLNDDELGEENDIGLIGDAKLSLIKRFSEVLQSMERNVKFNEKGDYDANLEVLSRYLSNLISLSELESENADFSNEELMEKLQEILNSTTVITMKNIDTIIPETEETVTEKQDSNSDSTGLDW